jgi:hypothetical protein
LFGKIPYKVNNLKSEWCARISLYDLST